MKQLTKMMTILRVVLLFSVLTTAAHLSAASGAALNIPNPSQDNDGSCSKYGPDSTRTLDEYSLYVEPFKQENYNEAISHWRYVYTNAPGFHEAVPIAGIRMYQYFIEQASDPVVKNKLVDTLMMIYDKRIACFGKEGYNLGRKGYDLMKYRPDSLEEIRMTFDKAIRSGKEETEYFILWPFAKLSGYAYQSKKLTEEDMFKLFENLMEIIEKNKGKTYEKQFEEARDQIVQHFTEIGILSCPNLIELHKAKLKANPDDPAAWKAAYTSLRSCDDCNKEFNATYKKLFEVDPSADLAIKIAQCESEMGNASEAIKYLDRAIEQTTDREQKARLAYNAAVISYGKLNNFSKAREYARKASEFRPNWGEPYLLIGRLYASSGSLCGPGTGFESQVVVWPALDMFERAKAVDPSVSSEANKLINQYTQYMPTKEQLFERGITEGSTYKVECWIQENTIVRGYKR